LSKPDNPQAIAQEGEPKESKTASKKTFVSVAEAARLEKALQEEKKKSEEYLTRLKYLQADFENFQKRTKKEIEEIVKYSNEDLIVSLLPVLDDLERALNASKSSGNKDAVIEGLELVLKETQSILFQKGLSPIDCVGKKFDPTKHEAVGFVSSNEHEDNTVIRELRKGYVLNGKVIRPSMVEVNRRTSTTT
jgi:molecular chaperone GrpE